MLLARILGGVAFGATSALLARMLGPSDFGRYTFIASVAVGVGYLGAMGVNRTLLRDFAVSRHTGATPELARDQDLAVKILAISVPAVGLSTAIGLRFLGYGGESVWLTALVCVLVMQSALQLVVADSLRGLGHAVAASFLEGRSGGAASFLALLILILPFATHEVSLVEAVALTALAYGIVLLVWARWLLPSWRSRHPRDGGIQADPASRGRFARVSASFLAAQMLAFGGTQGDLWIVAGAATPIGLALFSAAFRVTTIAATPLVAVQLAWTPALAYLYAARRTSDLEHVLKRAAAVATIPAAVSVLVFLFAGRWFMATVFGPVYAGSEPALVWLCVGQLANCATGLAGQALTMTGFQRDVVIASAAAVGIKVLVGVPIASSGGIVAYAAFSAFATTALNLVLLVAARARLGLWAYPSFRRSTLAAVKA